MDVLLTAGCGYRWNESRVRPKNSHLESSFVLWRSQRLHGLQNKIRNELLWTQNFVCNPKLLFVAFYTAYIRHHFHKYSLRFLQSGDGSPRIWLKKWTLCSHKSHLLTDSLVWISHCAMAGFCTSFSLKFVKMTWIFEINHEYTVHKSIYYSRSERRQLIKHNHWKQLLKAEICNAYLYAQYFFLMVQLTVACIARLKGTNGVCWKIIKEKRASDVIEIFVWVRDVRE